MIILCLSPYKACEQARLFGVLHVSILVAEQRLQASEEKGASPAHKGSSVAKILARDTPNKQAWSQATPYRMLLTLLIFVVCRTCITFE